MRWISLRRVLLGICCFCQFWVGAVGHAEAPASPPVGPVRVPVVLQNAGFEAAQEGGGIPGWRMQQHAGDPAYEMVVDRTTAIEGRQSFRIERKKNEVFGLIDQVLKMPTEFGEVSSIELTAKIRTKDVGAAGWGLVVNFNGPRGAILDQARSRFVSGTTDWTMVEIKASVPKKTLAMSLGLMLLDGGIAWADDIKLVLVTEKKTD